MLKKHLNMIIFTLMIGQLLAHNILLLKGNEYISVKLILDDTFYYLETAWNHHLLGFATFDGINNTNGFHFLWYIVVLCLSYITPEKALFLPYAIALCSLFNSLTYIFFIRISKKINSPELAIILSSLWFLANISPINSINGLENSLHIFIFCWVLYELFSFFYAINLNKKVHFFRLTLVLILNAYSRLDSGIFSAVIFIICILALLKISGGFKGFFCIYKKEAILSLIAIISSLFVLFSTYWYWGQTYIPISGIVKNSGLAYEYPTLKKALKVYKLGLANIPLLFYLGPLSSIALHFIFFFKIKSLSQLCFVLLKTHLVLFIGVVTYSAFMWLSPTTQGFGYWYFSPIKVYWIFTLSCLIFLINYFFTENDLKKLAKVTILGVFFSGITVGLYDYFTSIILEPNSKQNLYRVRYQVSKWMANNIPEDHVIASWNAGQFGFFSNHNVINLDGLINNKKYYDRVLKGNESLSNYLREKKVRYIVDYADYTDDKFTNQLSVIYKSSPISNNRVIKIWDFNSLPEKVEAGYLFKNQKH
jgi:hypothetical protein